MQSSTLGWVLGIMVILFATTANAGLVIEVLETGTDLAPETASFTGQTFDHTIEGIGFTVPLLDEDVPFFTDRNHEYNGVDEEKNIASLGLVGAEYVMLANDNRDVADYQLSITVGQAVDAYVLMDARVAQPAWLTDDGWTHLGMQRIGIDEGGDGVGAGMGINSQFYLWKMADIPEGTFVTKERGGTGNNMYGVVVTEPGIGPDVLNVPAVSFSYDTFAGGGTISGWLDTTHVGGSGDVEFSAAMPAPIMVDPNPGLTPEGSVGTITEQTGAHNDQGKTVGLDWSGMGPVELTGTDGVNLYTVPVNLVFGPSGDAGYNNIEEDPLSSYDPLLGPDFVYEWTIEISDDAMMENGGDAVSTGASNHPRMAVYFAVGQEAANGGSHRFTHIERQFNVGEDEYTNDHTTTTAIKWSKYAAYRDLGLFYGWRDRDTLSDGSFQIDSIAFSGKLLVDLSAIEVVSMETSFIRGDANGSGGIDLSDAITILGYLFGNPDDAGKVTVPKCFDAADGNDDEKIDLSDAIKVLDYLFGSNELLPLPGPTACGTDETTDPDNLDCSEYSCPE